MVDLLKQLQDKPKPLAKKAEELDTVKPTQPNIVNSLGGTQKQAEMAASPQAKKATEQQQMRTAEVKAEAPREVAGAGDFISNAQTMITNLANFNQANFDTTVGNVIEDSTIEAPEARSSESLIEETSTFFNLIDNSGHDPLITLGALSTQDPALYAKLSPYNRFDDTVTLKDLRANIVVEGLPSLDAAAIASDTITTEGFIDTVSITAGDMQQQNPELYEDMFSFLSDIEGMTQPSLDENNNPIKDANGNPVMEINPNLTIQEIQNIVDQQIDQMTAIVDNARETLNDPNAPANVRQEAMQNMIDYGAAHMIATDAELDEFQKDMSTVGVIEIDGETYTLEQLADNKTIAASILSAAKALISDSNATAKDLGLEDSPSLEAFVRKHTLSIISVLSTDEQNLTKAKEYLAANKEIIDSVPEEVKDIVGDLTPYTKDNLVSSTPGLVVFTPNFDPKSVGLESSIEVSEALKYMSKHDPEGVKAFMESGDLKAFTKLAENSYKHRNVDGIDSEAALGAHLDIDFKQLQTIILDASQNPEDYTPEQRELLSALNPDGFGIDNWKEAKDTLTKFALEGKTFNLSGVQTVDQKNKAQFKGILETGGITKDLLTPVGLDIDPYTGDVQKVYTENRAKVAAITKVIKELRALNNPAAKALIKKLADKKFAITNVNKDIQAKRRRGKPEDPIQVSGATKVKKVKKDKPKIVPSKKKEKGKLGQANLGGYTSDLSPEEKESQRKVRKLNTLGTAQIY